MKQVIIDVREKDEFCAEHIAGSINLPLSDLARQAPGIIKNIEGCGFNLMCLSGARSGLAKRQLEGLGLSSQFDIYEGGIQAWKQQGKPTEKLARAVLPMMRQVQLVAGLLILVSTTLVYFVDIRWLLVTLIVGGGLTTAGATGFCGMAHLLEWMPWNRTAHVAQER